MDELQELQELEELAELEELEKLEASQSSIKKQAQPVQTAKVSPSQSFQAGLAQGGTLGFGEEIMGGIRAARDVMGDKFELSDLPERYRQRRDEYRQYNELARQQNPKTYMGGEIVGGVGTSLVPGMGAATLGKTAAMGGVAGLGLSEADLTQGQIGEAALDTGIGGITGGLAYGATKGAGALLSKARPKQIAKSYLGLPEPAYERLVKDPEAVKSALSKADDFYGLPDISRRLTDRIGDLKEEAISGSRAARETVDFEGTRLPKQKLYDYLQGKLDAIKRSEGRIPDDAYAAAKDVLNKQMKKIEGVEDLTGPEIMDRVREMRKAVEYNQATGAIDSKSEAAIKEVARLYDQALKEASPAYTGIMSDAAQASRLLEQAKPLARSEQGAMNLVGSIDKAGNKFKADILRELDKRYGDTLSDDAMNAIAARIIDRSAAAGSQRVNLGSKIGGAIGAMFPGEKFGKVMEAGGAAAGAAVDAYGRRMAIPLVEQAAKIDRLIQTNRFSRPIADALKKAAEKGPQNLVLTFQLLSRDNPELAQSIGE